MASSEVTLLKLLPIISLVVVAQQLQPKVSYEVKDTDSNKIADHLETIGKMKRMKLYYYLEFRILLPKWHLLITRIHNETTSISQSISSGWSLAFDILGTAVLLLCHRSITRLNWREVELRSVWCQFLTFVGRFSMTHLALGYMLSLILLSHLLKYSLALVGCILFKSACIPKSV